LADFLGYPSDVSNPFRATPIINPPTRECYAGLFRQLLKWMLVPFDGKFHFDPLKSYEIGEMPGVVDSSQRTGNFPTISALNFHLTRTTASRGRLSRSSIAFS
jgi:hypothetical protein